MSTSGTGLIRARLLPPSRLVLPALTFQYPLKLISSSVPSSPCLTVFMLSYGGGLVSNDKIDLSVEVEPAAKLCLLTQGSTKIFKQKSPDHLTTQTLTCALHPHASLLLLPDPVQPFARSAYRQHQIFRLPHDNSASLIVLDWVTEGRSALGEHWDLTGFISRNEIFTARADGSQRLMLRDSLILERGEGDEADELKRRMDGFTVFATLVVHGAKFMQLGAAILQKFRDEPRIGGRNFDNRQDFKKDEGRKGGTLWTAASVRGFVLVKISGKELEEVRQFLRSLLLLGGESGESEVIAEFGEGVLLCLQ